MNIFKALSDGHGTISETNITSFLSYMLNQTSEFGSSFITQFLMCCEQADESIELFNLLGLESFENRELIYEIDRFISVEAIPEQRVRHLDGDQIIDIVVRFQDAASSKDVLYILIENKINSSALARGQLRRQFEAVASNEDYEEDCPILSVLIHPDKGSFREEVEECRNVNPITIGIKWVSRDSNESSIYNQIQKLIELESTGRIPPIELHTNTILKNFLEYIWERLSNVSSGKRVTSINGQKVIDSIKVEIKSGTEYLNRYENGMIRFVDEDGVVVDEPVKPKLRELIEHYKLNVELVREGSSRKKNTQILGRDVLNALLSNS